MLAKQSYLIRLMQIHKQNMNASFIFNEWYSGQHNCKVNRCTEYANETLLIILNHMN